VDFVKYGKPAFIGSWLVRVARGRHGDLQRPFDLTGIDFAGGDEITVQFKEHIDTGKIREIAKANGIPEVNPVYVSALGGGNETLKIETPEGKSGALLVALQKAVPSAGLERIGENHIGASIGKEIEFNALLSVGVSMLVILVYIAFRFEFGFGVGAMFSTLHDILMTIGIFVLTGRQFSAPMSRRSCVSPATRSTKPSSSSTAIREELKLNPTGTLRDIINSAINKVFARTIMTASTTFLAALALFLFGGGVLRNISFTFLVGIVTSTFSAIFIAAQVFYWCTRATGNTSRRMRMSPRSTSAGSSKASE